jgi:HSP20 family protein
MAFNLQPRTRSNFEPRIIGERDSIFDDIFNDFFYPLPSYFRGPKGADLSPRIDISETDKEYHLEAELPGLTQKDIEVKVDGGILNIKGNKEESHEEKEKNYYLRERYYGAFQRSVALPSNVMADNIEAKFENGILNITIPKQNKGTAKKIDVK